MRVLLIEDEPTTAKAIELMLTTGGFNVYSTDLGEEGLDLGKGSVRTNAPAGKEMRAGGSDASSSQAGQPVPLLQLIS